MEIRGVSECINVLNDIKKVVETGARRELLADARLVRNAIRQKAPRGPTGNLKRAIVAKLLPKSNRYQDVAIAGVNYRRAPHGHLVEYGHAGPHPAPAYPFFRPAIDEVKGQVQSNMKEAMRKATRG